MITKGDEYPLHQSSRPVRDPGSEKNLYDRFFFNGYEPDGSLFFAVALGQYPGRNVMDGAFSVIADGVQHNVRASRILGDDRLDTRVGAVTVTIAEPLRRLRVDVDDSENGVRAALDFTARGPAFEEPHYFHQQGYRATFDITRMTQAGGWDGTVEVAGRTFEVSRDRVLGTRDRSWGVRPVGERDAQGAPDGPIGRDGPASRPGFYWLWAPLNFADECVLFDVNEYPDGTRWHESAMRASNEPNAAVDHGRAQYDLHFKPGTRHAESAELNLVSSNGARHYVLQPQFNFYMQGIGYGHPKWGHGMFVGPDERGYDSFVVADVDEADFLHQHIQAFCQVTRDDGATGVGILEQLIFGPHDPSGLAGILDMHP